MSVLATIEPTELQVDPGAEASLLVRVRNRGTIVDRFDIAVVGPTAGWATVDPPSLRLFPDKEGEARVTFRPPRAPTPASDTYPFGVAVRAASDANASTVEEGHVSVAPFVQLTTEIVPQTSRGSRSGSHDVTVHNIGNSVADVSVKASDPDRLLTFEVLPERAGLRPDGATTIRARVKPKETFFLGPAKRIPFAVQVDEPTAGSYQIPATIEQHAIIPSWIKPVAGLAIAGVVALAFLPKLLFPEPAATVAPTQFVFVPTPAPITAPPVTVAPITAPPTAVPTPVIFGPPDALTAAGDEGGLNGDMGLTLKCPPGDPCRDGVQALYLGILDNLLGKADGALLIDFNATPTGVLPVEAEWSGGSFLYTAAGQPPTETRHVSIDLAPIVGGSPAYALVEDVNGIRHKFVVPPLDGKNLFDSLYLLAAVPTPPPDPSGGGFDYSGWRNTAVYNGLLISNIAFLVPTATP